MRRLPSGPPLLRVPLKIPSGSCEAARLATALLPRRRPKKWNIKIKQLLWSIQSGAGATVPASREAQGDAACRGRVQVGQRLLRRSPAGLGRVALQNPGVQNARVSCPGWHSRRGALDRPAGLHEARRLRAGEGSFAPGAAALNLQTGFFSPLSENLTNKTRPHQIRVAPMISWVLGWGGGTEVRRAV